MKRFKELFLLFFLMSFSLGYAQPSSAAATPPARTAADVIRLYTDSYSTSSQIAGLVWANSTTTTIGGNNTRYGNNVSFSQAAFGATNVSAMTHLHIDLYNFTSSATSYVVQLNGNVTVSAPLGQWTSIDIPLTSYTNLSNVNLINIRPSNNTNSVYYYDNIYFYKQSSGGNPAPVFGAWTLPTKTVGDGDFTISPPTTDSGGTISYTSGTPGVATIVAPGNVIHIVGAGTSTITLNQAADATHSAGSTTATLTVNGAPPSTAAPTPPARNSWDVISLYSGAYTTLPGAVYQHGTDVTIAGNTTRFISNLLLARLAFPPTNMSAMTTLHIDVYSLTLDPTWFELQGVRVTRNTAINGWVSLDIPLSSFTALNLSSVSFFDLNNPTGAVAPQDDMYVDNVYLYRPATTLPPTLGAFTLPTKNLGDPDFTITPPTSNSAGAWSYSSGTTGVATIVNGNQIHIVGPGSSLITATQAADGSYGQGVTTATFTVNYPDPPASPTQPGRSPGDVVSIFAAAYSDISGTNFNPNWGQSTNYPSNMTTPTYSGETVKRYLNSGTYQGTNFTAQNLTVINKLHVDIYSYGMTSLRISLITEGVAEAAYPVSLTPNSWNSFNIDINSTNFPGVNLSSVNQIKYDQFKIGAAETGNQVLIIDNLYFYRETNVPPTLGSFSVGPNLTTDANYTITPPTSNSAGAWSYSSSNPLVATIVAPGDVIHIVGAGTSTITATQAANGIYASASTTATLTVTVPPLSTAAPTPPARNPWDVISLYSDAYTTLTGAIWQFGSDVQLEGNDTRYIENMLLARLAFPPTNISAMTHMHIDVYSETLNPTWFELQGIRVTKSTPVNGWVSLDIALSEFTGLNLSSVNFFDLNNPTGAVAPADNVYVDNVYFYRPATSIPPTLSDFSIPTKAYNDPDFVITPPTSNSTGTFSYTSSNENVATIVNGNMIHIVGGGTSTITANQAADGGSYGIGSISTTFTVTFAPPSASPIPPARTPDRVISLFTGNPPVYTNAITLVNAMWSSASMTEVPNGTNTALQLDNFGFAGLTDVTETRMDVSGMSHLHIDIYLNEPLNSNPALSRVNIFVLANNGDYLFQASNLTTGWNSLSIPMTNFSAADLAHVWGLKLESINPATQIYVDNIYFSNECYTYYEDADLDGFGNPAVTQSVCDGSGAPAGFVTDNTDCNDGQLQYVDIDSDGFGSNTQVACGVTNHSDCNDNQLQYADLDADGFGSATLVACGVTNHDDCDDGTVRYADNDNDGFGSLVKVACGGVTNSSDCDDNLLRYADTDNDGYGSLVKVACGGVTNNTDCDDTKNTVHPGAAEIGYNLIDDDCDGLTDEGFPPKNTTITGAQCGLTLSAIDNQIYADLVAGAQGYQWKITNMTGPNAGQVQLLGTTLRVMRLTQLASYAYNTAYKVEVAVYYAGYLQPYMPSSCTVTTPAITTSLSNCNQTLSSMSDVIYANSVLAASGYRFRITEGANTTILDRPVREFRMNLITDFQVKFNKTYSVQVAVKNTDGTYLPYGSVCSVNTPVFPTTSIQDSQCDDYAPATMNTIIYATSYPGAISYVFNLSGNNLGATGVDVVKSTRSFKLSDFSGLIPGATYNVKVRLVFNSSDPAGAYGKTCTVTVPGSSRIAQLPFDAKAYPNPFADSFNIDVTTSANDNINVKVYDMTGRLLENKSTTASEMETLQVGDKFPAGVYNVIVSQGEEVKTLRVIKR